MCSNMTCLTDRAHAAGTAVRCLEFFKISFYGLLTAGLLLAAVPAAALELCGNLKQGEILRGYAPGAQKVLFDGSTYPINSDTGAFLLVLSRDAAPEAELSVVHKDGSAEKYKFSIEKNAWDIQSIKGVAQRKVTPAKTDQAEILREQKDVKAALTITDMQRNSWEDGFMLPVKGPISGHFGNQRIFNGIPKSPHSGTDIAVAEGTPVKAAGNGKVVLSGGNYFYSGNMVILDHGYGLQTIYMHLREAKVKVGDEVKKGEIIGLAGKTGRATGPHLHWGASLNNVRFRPHSLLAMDSGQCRELTAE